ncbi:Rv3235 family protein [Kitasatospora sp. NPDC004240]
MPQHRTTAPHAAAPHTAARAVPHRAAAVRHRAEPLAEPLVNAPRGLEHRTADRRTAAADRRPRHPRAVCEAASRPALARAELTARFAHRLVEVLTGVRPCGQLQRHTTLDGYGQLAALVRSGPLRRGGAAARPRLGPVHDRSPAGDAVEACVRVDLGVRHHMVAFRLELQPRSGRWQCAAVEAR